MTLSVSNVQIKEELRRQWAAHGVEMALMGRWDDAIRINLQVLSVFPDDIQARNRLGKAYLELGRHEEAAEAYEQSLLRQPSGSIARKRLGELHAMLPRAPQKELGTPPQDAESSEEAAADGSPES